MPFVVGQILIPRVCKGNAVTFTADVHVPAHEIRSIANAVAFGRTAVLIILILAPGRIKRLAIAIRTGHAACRDDAKLVLVGRAGVADEAIGTGSRTPNRSSANWTTTSIFKRYDIVHHARIRCYGSLCLRGDQRIPAKHFKRYPTGYETALFKTLFIFQSITLNMYQ